ncbi:MAG TPA: hypothetical protein PLJ44_07030 [Victivallales bacterium]|nr:hypothetical protein [Victivallales bacterium]
MKDNTNYPPDLQEKAVETVLSQAKLPAEDLVANGENQAGD